MLPPLPPCEAASTHYTHSPSLPAQVSRDHKGCEGGPEAARGSAAEGLPPLLHGYEVYLAGGCCFFLSSFLRPPICRGACPNFGGCKPAGLRGMLGVQRAPGGMARAASPAPPWPNPTGARPSALRPAPTTTFAGDFTQASGREVAALLRAAGAKQLSRPPAAAPAPRAGAGPCTSLLLCEAPEPGSAGSPTAGGAGGQPAAAAAAAEAGDQAQAQGAAAAAVPPAIAGAKWYQKAVEGGVPVVRHGWLLDSISCYTIQPLSRYRL